MIRFGFYLSLLLVPSFLNGDGGASVTVSFAEKDTGAAIEGVCRLEISQVPSFNPIESSAETGCLPTPVSALTPNTTYYFRAYAADRGYSESISVHVSAQQIHEIQLSLPPKEPQAPDDESLGEQFENDEYPTDEDDSETHDFGENEPDWEWTSPDVELE